MIITKESLKALFDGIDETYLKGSDAEPLRCGCYAFTSGRRTRWWHIVECNKCGATWSNDEPRYAWAEKLPLIRDWMR